MFIGMKFFILHIASILLVHGKTGYLFLMFISSNQDSAAVIHYFWIISHIIARFHRQG